MSEKNTQAAGDRHRLSETEMRATMERFSHAWACGNIDALMALMSDAPVYRTSGGATFEGSTAVREGFARICRPADPAAPPAPPSRLVFFDDQCLSYWTLSLPGADGELREVDGIDVIGFDSNGRIRIKDAYRKL
jgi:hypothetical protein